MPHLKFICPVTGNLVDTGMNIDEESFAALSDATVFSCIARNCTASMRFKGGSAKSCLNLNSVIDGLAPGIASQKTTRSEAEARPHCKLARISPADRLDPHLNFVTPNSPVCANSLCQILRAFPGKLHGL